MLKNFIALSFVKKRNSQITLMSLCANPVEWCETINPFVPDLIFFHEDRVTT